MDEAFVEALRRIASERTVERGRMSRDTLVQIARNALLDAGLTWPKVVVPMAAAQKLPVKIPQSVIIVPAWVPASLSDNYVAIARREGEEEAASYCRRMKNKSREAA